MSTTRIAAHRRQPNHPITVTKDFRDYCKEHHISIPYRNQPIGYSWWKSLRAAYIAYKRSSTTI